MVDSGRKKGLKILELILKITDYAEGSGCIPNKVKYL